MNLIFKRNPISNFIRFLVYSTTDRLHQRSDQRFVFENVQDIPDAHHLEAHPFAASDTEAGEGKHRRDLRPGSLSVRRASPCHMGDKRRRHRATFQAHNGEIRKSNGDETGEDDHFAIELGFQGRRHFVSAVSRSSRRRSVGVASRGR